MYPLLRKYTGMCQALENCSLRACCYSRLLTSAKWGRRQEVYYWLRFRAGEEGSDVAGKKGLRAMCGEARKVALDFLPPYSAIWLSDDRARWIGRAERWSVTLKLVVRRGAVRKSVPPVLSLTTNNRRRRESVPLFQTWRATEKAGAGWQYLF